MREHRYTRDLEIGFEETVNATIDRNALILIETEEIS